MNHADADDSQSMFTDHTALSMLTLHASWLCLTVVNSADVI